jgi:hypothetical protein
MNTSAGPSSECLGNEGTTSHRRKIGSVNRQRITELLEWGGAHGAVLVTNNAKDFEPLHREYDHAGILLYYEQHLPDTDPEGLARTSMRYSLSMEPKASKTNSSILARGTSGSTSSADGRD